jgi:hypothetical protein
MVTLMNLMVILAKAMITLMNLTVILTKVMMTLMNVMATIMVKEHKNTLTKELN